MIKDYRGKQRFKPDRKTVIYIVLRVLVVACLIRQILLNNWENAALCVLTLVLFMLPAIIERRFKVELPDTLTIIILCFIFAAEILGEIDAFYEYFPYWDSILHTLNGFLCAAIGFSLVDVLNRSDRVSLRLSPGYMALVAFCFSMTVGVLWEFFEFSMDQLFYLDMQKDTVVTAIGSVMLDPTGGNTPVYIGDITTTTVNGQTLPINGYLDIGLIDTMADLFVNFIGALIFSFIGASYVKNREKGSFAERFIPVVAGDEVKFEESASDDKPQLEKTASGDRLRLTNASPGAIPRWIDHDDKPSKRHDSGGGTHLKP